MKGLYFSTHFAIHQILFYSFSRSIVVSCVPSLGERNSTGTGPSQCLIHWIFCRGEGTAECPPHGSQPPDQGRAAVLYCTSASSLESAQIFTFREAFRYLPRDVTDMCAEVRHVVPNTYNRTLSVESWTHSEGDTSETDPVCGRYCDGVGDDYFGFKLSLYSSF